MKIFFGSIAVLAALLFGATADAQEAVGNVSAPTSATGTLVVEIKPYTSEKPLPKKVDKQLKNGGLEWGVKDNTIVFTSVNKQFVNFPITHLTRFAQNEQISLPVGEYAVTAVGLEMSPGFDVMKLLDRGAFVNENILTFRIEAGKTTTISINPVIKRDNAFLVDFWMPTMMASLKADIDTNGNEEKALNQRTETSIAWSAYTGPLKFVAK